MLLKQQTIQFSAHSTLYDLIVPKENILRKINDLIDFSFIYDKSQNKVVPLQQLINNLSTTLEEVSKSLEDVREKVKNM